MKHIAIASLLLCACATGAAAPPPANLHTAAAAARMSEAMYAAQYYEATGAQLFESRVFGGAPANPGDDPWQVALVLSNRSNQSVFCSGSIIDSERLWVATAAHCVHLGARPDAIEIIAGTINLSAPNIRRVRVAEIIVHRDWDDSYGWATQVRPNDIALLRLRAPATGQHIPRPHAGTPDLPGGSTARVTGWGASETAPLRVDHLRYANILVVSNQTCANEAVRGSAILPNMMCAGQDAGSCENDSGGPLTTGSGATASLVGIVSYAPSECGHPDLPGVYTKVSAFAGWLDACTGREGSNRDDCVRKLYPS